MRDSHAVKSGNQPATRCADSEARDYGGERAPRNDSPHARNRQRNQARDNSDAAAERCARRRGGTRTSGSKVRRLKILFMVSLFVAGDDADGFVRNTHALQLAHCAFHVDHRRKYSRYGFHLLTPLDVRHDACQIVKPSR